MIGMNVQSSFEARVCVMIHKRRFPAGGNLVENRNYSRKPRAFSLLTKPARTVGQLPSVDPLVGGPVGRRRAGLTGWLEVRCVGRSVGRMARRLSFDSPGFSQKQTCRERVPAVSSQGENFDRQNVFAEVNCVQAIGTLPGKHDISDASTP